MGVGRKHLNYRDPNSLKVVHDVIVGEPDDLIAFMQQRSFANRIKPKRVVPTVCITVDFDD